MKYSDHIREVGRNLIRSQIEAWSDATCGRGAGIVGDWKRKAGDPDAEYEVGETWLSGGVHDYDNGSLSPYSPIPEDAVEAYDDVEILDTETSMGICLVYCGHEEKWLGRMTDGDLFVGPYVQGEDPDKVFATIAAINGDQP